MTQFIAVSFEDSDLRGFTTSGWYFWDETRVYCYGPYADEAEAKAAAARYCREMLGENPDATLEGDPVPRHGEQR